MLATSDFPDAALCERPVVTAWVAACVAVLDALVTTDVLTDGVEILALVVTVTLGADVLTVVAGLDELLVFVVCVTADVVTTGVEDLTVVTTGALELVVE